jgi:hypothetical protein
MSLIKKNPVWLSVLIMLIAWYFFVNDPTRRAFYVFSLVIGGFTLLLQLVFQFLKRLNPAPVPDSAIRDMMKACHEDEQNGDWIIIAFPPKISLAEARSRAGSDDYSTDDRLRSFILKVQMIAPSLPRTAIFYSPNKGFLVANRELIQYIEKRYGRWMLDTWYSLNGALNKEALSTEDLDASRVFTLR